MQLERYCQPSKISTSSGGKTLQRFSVPLGWLLWINPFLKAAQVFNKCYMS